MEDNQQCTIRSDQEKQYEQRRLAACQRYRNNLVVDNGGGEYLTEEDSHYHPSVPRGAVSEHEILDSQIYPGSRRSYWVYKPAQYQPDHPAALMVFQDGEGMMKGDLISTLPVLDNLIARGEIPVMIAVFVNPGAYPGQSLPERIDQQPRQVEYDTQSDRYVRFLLEELLPKVKTHYNISDDPEQRALAGVSSGGMAAWTAAWHRPDQFRKVLTFIGSFTDVLGGHQVPSAVRKEPRKPIRVFLQSGSNDHNIEFGDWALANQTMASALAFSEYDYRFVFGDGWHDTAHANRLLPNAMRWLWRDA